MFYLLLLFFLPLSSSQNLEKSRSVWVEQGLVRGKIYKIGDKQLQIFRGIPYAEPPVGDLRFRKPTKKSRWHQELAAVEYGSPCLQFMDFHRNDRFASESMKRESEDCLYLNVFSPYDGDDESSLSPILVWIHGGSFLAGSGDTGIDMEVVAKNIVFKGVTLVTLNYRLGPLGFMNYNMDGKVEGNFGIYDIIMALEWIQANIKQLNGDPSRITLMGESAGGAAVSLLSVSPLTRDLFHRSIVMSGSSAAGWAVHTHGTPMWSIENMISYLRCERAISEEDANEIVGEEFSEEEIGRKHCNYQEEKIACLSPDMNTQEMLSCLTKSLNFSSSLFRRALATELGVSKVIVDGHLLSSSGADFISENARIPLLTGVAKSEWSHKKPQFYNLPRLTNLTKEEVEQAVFKVIDTSFHQSVKDKLTNSTLLLLSNASFVRYMDDPTGQYATANVVTALQKVMEADIEFVAPCHREISAYQSKGIPVFAYSFDYLPESPIYEEEKKIFSLFGKQPIDIVRKDANFADHKLEAFHGLDHAYIFSQGYTSNFEIRPFTKRDDVMSKMLTNMWTNFVKTGDPSTARFKWPITTPEETQYVSIQLPPKVIQGDIHFPSPKFWNVEADLISRFVSKGTDRLTIDPASELTNEERVELSAYRRAWWALWVLVGVLAFLLWSFVIYIALKKSRAPRSKPYDNIVVAAR
ncbi:hypothetical protein PRIPAC_75907 [Pristionchus pacificus]|uniref:Hydrolase n=1 Tax=Pristionchus pacificus TaxID=54126 RepID=A0A2A6BGE3_PRIPA|nr:hypothetical protein PRIPAC_75907 [Pristionchus pacificus]|eukprot:PDM64926.1 hydrolase [Pristionchus pacificus]